MSRCTHKHPEKDLICILHAYHEGLHQYSTLDPGTHSPTNLGVVIPAWPKHEDKADQPLMTSQTEIVESQI